MYGYEFEVNYYTAFDLADLSAKGDPIAKQWIMEGVQCVYQTVVESIRKRVALTAQVSNHVAVLFRKPFQCRTEHPPSQPVMVPGEWADGCYPDPPQPARYPNGNIIYRPQQLIIHATSILAIVGADEPITDMPATATLTEPWWMETPGFDEEVVSTLGWQNMLKQLNLLMRWDGQPASSVQNGT